MYFIYLQICVKLKFGDLECVSYSLYFVIEFFVKLERQINIYKKINKYKCCKGTDSPLKRLSLY